MDLNFKLIGYSVYAEYNDFSSYNKIETNTNLDEIIKKNEELLLNLQNCDKYYHTDYTELFEITNPEYFKFADFPKYSYEENELTQEEHDFIKNKQIIAGKCIKRKIKTPKKNIPLNIKLIEKVNETIPFIINVNGLTDQNNLNKTIDLLNQLKK